MVAKRCPGMVEVQVTFCCSSWHRATLILRMCPEPGRDVAWGRAKDTSDRATAGITTQAPKLAVI